jgi:diadenylate cyclase
MLHADLSAELLRTLFSPRAPLHDGAVIVHGDRVLAAAAVLPLPETSVHHERFGTRHRAALGLAEEVDAAVVVVSEERGEISLAVDGALHRGLDEAALRQLLARLLAPAPPRGVSALLARLGFPAPQRSRKDREDHRAAV